MRNARGASVVASPVLIGAVTLLITVVAVFLAYNANQGLPFVPTYDVRAELPTGNKLVKGNEVRVGGFRVGVVSQVNPKVIGEGDERRTIAVVDMKLDKTVDPLAKDSTVQVRPRSALGLKYVELSPGTADETFSPGDTIPIGNTTEPLEFEDLYSTFNDEMRQDSQVALTGFGNAFAGRGQSLNETIREFSPFLQHLTPVMRTLSDRDTELNQFFLQLGRAAEQAAPVARIQAQLFTDMADTFAAISRNPEALRQTIEKSPVTMDVAIRSFRVQRPFLADFADLSRRLRPAAEELPRSLPAINEAFRVGTPILPRTVTLNERLEHSFETLQETFEDPNTLLVLKDLRTALSVLRPLIEFVAPYQTVCNYPVYFINALGEHQSNTGGGSFPGGTVQNQGAKLGNAEQPNTVQQTDAPRNWDIPPLNEDPRHRDRPPGWNNEPARGARFANEPAGRLAATPYFPAIDAQGNADCQNGQTGYPQGPLAPGARYGPGYVMRDGQESDIPSGGNFPIAIRDYPVLTGGTYVTRKLGIDNLRDVP